MENSFNNMGSSDILKDVPTLNYSQSRVANQQQQQPNVMIN